MRLLVGGLVAAVMFLAVDPALAHTGSGAVSGFAAGFTHPLAGIDHLLAMVLVGLWAAQLGGRAMWMVPLSFVLLMAIGGGAAIVGIALPQVELVIALSVVILGALVAARVLAPAAVAATIVAIFGVMHGHAHGAEMPVTGPEAWYVAGFMLATIGLHGVGIAVSSAGRSKSFVRYVGAASAVVGLALIG